VVVLSVLTRRCAGFVHSRMSEGTGLARRVTPVVCEASVDSSSLPAKANGQQAACLGRETVVAALEELKRGRPVVVTDDADRENEGDLILAAESATPEALAFVARHTSGVICVAMRGERLDELELPPMVSQNQDPKGTAFTVSVDLKGRGVTTGISASDRAKTIAALADPSLGPDDFCRPGHLFPLRARPGGVLERGGHTEAAVDLASLAGLYPAGALCEIVRDDDGEMSRGDHLDRFRRTHGLVMTTIEDIRQYRRDLLVIPPRPARKPRRLPVVDDDAKLDRATGRIRMPTKHGDFEAVCFVEQATGLEHIALVRGFEKAPLDDDDDDDDDERAAPAF